MSAFEAAMKMCDDCGRTGRPLRWFGQYIRICEPCRQLRTEREAVPATQPESSTQ